MKSIIKNVLFFIPLIILFDFIFYKSRLSFGGSPLFAFAEVVIYFSLFFLFLLSILYKKVFTFKSAPFKIIIILLLVFIISHQFASRMMAMNKFYYYAKSVPNDVTPGIYTYDRELAYKARPNTSGSYNYYIGDSIIGRVPVFYDSGGYRTVPDSLQLKSASKDLFLGCSFTFGDLVNAENTYAYLTAKGLGHSYINAATSGYGMAQMYELGNKLIPANHFTYVFIQLSPWLADRAMGIRSITYNGYWPFPYFSKDKDGKFELNKPAFGILNTKEHAWRDTKPSYMDKLRFCAEHGLTGEFTDYYSYNFAKLKAWLGITPNPVTNKEDLEVYFYNYMVDFCKAHNTTPVILKLGYNYPEDQRVDKIIKSLAGKAQIVDIDSARLSEVKSDTSMQYSRLFKIWYVGKNGDSVFVDNHPSIYAHKVFADKIISVLKQP